MHRARGQSSRARRTSAVARRDRGDAVGAAGRGGARGSGSDLRARGAKCEKPVRRQAVSRLPRGELARIREWLETKRRALKDHIQSELTELESQERKHRTDLEEMASDTHDADPLCEIMGMESLQLDQIDRAIEQIDQGTYGICEECGGDIPLARLQALPFATQCIECKRRSELSANRPGSLEEIR